MLGSTPLTWLMYKGTCRRPGKPIRCSCAGETCSTDTNTSTLHLISQIEYTPAAAARSGTCTCTQPCLKNTQSKEMAERPCGYTALCISSCAATMWRSLRHVVRLKPHLPATHQSLWHSVICAGCPAHQGCLQSGQPVLLLRLTSCCCAQLCLACITVLYPAENRPAKVYRDGASLATPAAALRLGHVTCSQYSHSASS
jgi:hypothetical protein